MPRAEKKSRAPLAPVTTPEAQENRGINLAVSLAERQMADGTASAQVITHYLKLASPREKLEREKLIQENELLKAKVQQIASMENAARLAEDALRAMRTYTTGDVQEERPL